MGVKYVIDNETMTEIADPLRSLTGRTDELTPAEMAAAGAAANSEVQTQADLIAQIGAALEGKAGSGSGIVPTGTKQITTNGTHDVTAYAYAEVAVPSEMPETVTQATPVISVSSSGKITATATQTEGFVVGGTKTATKQLTTKGATTITPTTSVQTAVSAGTYVTGDIKVAAVSGGGGGSSNMVGFTVTKNDVGAPVRFINTDNYIVTTSKPGTYMTKGGIVVFNYANATEYTFSEYTSITWLTEEIMVTIQSGWQLEIT